MPGYNLSQSIAFGASNSLLVWIGGDRHRLPRLCLSLRNHEFLSMCVGPCEQLLPSPLLPGTLTSIQIQRFCPNGHQCVTRVVVDPYNICHALCDCQGVNLIARLP